MPPMPMLPMLRRPLLTPFLLLAGCAAPGTAVQPQATDFAFLEVKLRG